MDALLDGSIAFDVAAAREHATALVTLAEEQDAFEAWTRSLGKGPENREPGAFVAKGWRCRACGAAMRSGDDDSACRACDNLDVTGDDWIESEFCGGWPGKLAREWPGDSRAPMGRSIARLGQRILDMLEGQPSECQACGGLGFEASEWGQEAGAGCPDCQGTGHNLRGFVPDIEWSPAVRRAVVDHVQALHDGASENLPSWKTELGRRAASPGQRVLSGALKLTIAGWNERTRVTPRGRYVRQPDTGPTGVKLRDQLRGANVWRANAAAESPMKVHPPQAAHHDAHVRDWKRSKFPRWYQGELRRALQRRETST